MHQSNSQVAPCNLSILQQEINGDLIQTVNARELHSELGIKKKFPDWIKLQIERGQLVENSDYVLVFPLKGKNPKGGRPTTEYHVAIDAGKAIAMMSGGDKGAEVRRYFIQCEKQLRQQAPLIPQNLPEALRLAADLAEKNTRLEHQVAEAQPKVEALDRIATAEDSQTITIAAKNLQLKRKDLLQWLYNNRWIYKSSDNEPWSAYDKIRHAGLMEHKITEVRREDDTIKVCTQARITPKGLTRISSKLNQEVAQ